MPQSLFSETIFALSSGRLPAGVAVIRLSGPHVAGVLRKMCGKVPPERNMAFVRFRDLNGQTIDRGLAVIFEGPRSFTGDDCAEMHFHGGRAVAGRMLEVLGALSGMRMAEAGEFTRRAFINGKIDLTAAEGLADLIEAETEAQRRFALENSEGGQRLLYKGWRDRIIRARATIEAELDFSDEEDVAGSASDGVWEDISDLANEVRRHADGYKRAEIIRDGFKVAIVGAPNAGKSSLLNALARRDVAIVSDEPGTTRDVVSVKLDLNGVAVVVSDTAGIRDEAGKLESLGIERSFRTAGEADLVVVLREYGKSDAGIPEFEGKQAIQVISKIDLADDFENTSGALRGISTWSGKGMEALITEIGDRANQSVGPAGEILPSRIRHLSELMLAASHLEKACNGQAGLTELRAEELRIASSHLGRIIGSVDVEDLLDVIFSKFCIGK
jgi:tRNA modification GTPase